MNKKERIKSFLTEYITQDNLGTAFPIFFVIKTEEFKYFDKGEWDAGEHDGVTTAYCHPDYNDGQAVDDIEELIKEIKEYAEEDEQHDEIEDIKRLNKVRFWREEHLFLTKSAAHNHFQRNRYHYSKNAHVYCKHAWRNHKFETFILDLLDHFEIKEEVKK